ncbi:protein KTI12 homolog, partial [Trichonephila clavata]
AQKEKELRSSLKSEVERHLSKDTTVILDAGNYIKGYRYELYCLSKGCKTTHCVIHCVLLPNDCWIFNEKHDSSEQYSQEFNLSQLKHSPTIADLQSKWLGRLPNNTQTILTALKEDLAGLASVADKINDLADHSNINSVTPQTSDNRVAQLEKQVAQLTTLVGELTTTMHQSRSQGRNRN